MADTEEVEEYEVEQILSDDVVDGQSLYLVKWKGYADEECTWEPAENFTSEESIVAWEKQKAAGLGLPDEIFVGLQEKMDRFQATGERPTPPLEGQPQYDSADSNKSKEQSTKRQKRIHDSDHATSTAAGTTKSSSLHKKGIALPRRTLNKPKISVSLAKRTTRSGKPTDGSVSTNKSRFERAGQRFRTLSHQNNYRKKARQEPPPILPPGKLKTVADFDIGRETAHILPPLLERNDQPRTESPLFIPDTSGMSTTRSVSPPASESSIFPPPKASHVRATDTGTSANSLDNTINENVKPEESRVSLDNLATREDRSLHDIEMTAAPELIKPISIPQLGFGGPSPAVLPVAETPSGEHFRFARNGRHWFYGDVVCHFSMGDPVGVAKIVHLPHYPFGASMMSLKGTSTLTLDFERHGFKRPEFERFFTNSHTPAKAIALVCPYEDTQHSFDGFATWLEEHDSAAVLHFRDNRGAEYSILLYSIDSVSWQGYGWKPAREADGRPRLHIAFLPRLIPRQQPRPPSPREQRPATQAVRSGDVRFKSEDHEPLSLQRTQRRDSLPGRRTRSPSLSHEVNNISIQTPISPMSRSDPFASLPQSPAAGLTNETDTIGLTPESPGEMQSLMGERRPQRRNTNQSRAGSVATAQASSKQQILQAQPGLEYRSLLRQFNPKFDKTKARFFISFAQSVPKDAEALQVWFEKYTKASNIYLDSERHDWVRLKEKAHDTISVLLFHKDHPNYHKLSGLGKILSHDQTGCFAISFGYKSNGDIDLESTTIEKLFPRRTAYLVTESMIVRNLEETMTLMQYFDSSKKLGYKMIMRPDIERWLLEYASKVEDDIKRGTLIELLVKIRTLRPSSNVLEEFDLDDETQVADADDNNLRPNASYIISPSSIPGYDEVAISNRAQGDAFYTAASSVQDIQDEILRSYFAAYAATHADRTRRFLAFYNKASGEKHLATLRQREKDDTFDFGPIAFFELENFVARYCHHGANPVYDGDNIGSYLSV